jgi:hypothetical protein
MKYIVAQDPQAEEEASDMTRFTPVPCPYCKQLRDHLGSCQLSYMRTGKINIVCAIVVQDPQAEQEASDDVQVPVV